MCGWFPEAVLHLGPSNGTAGSGRTQATPVRGAFDPLRVGCRGRGCTKARWRDTAQVREYAQTSPHPEAAIGSQAAKPNQSLSNAVSLLRI
jgi:hypothetical protein